MSEQYFGIIHCHSDHSLKDSPLRIRDLCDYAKEMGVNAITLTDHGTCTGIIEFMDTCASIGINGIPGVEAYVQTDYASHAHLLLLAKNYKGYQEICRAISEANENLVNIGGIMSPIMTKEVLQKHFGNGNVIATSACISGILASVLNFNEQSSEKLKKLQEKQSKYESSEDPAYIKNKEKLQELDRQIAVKAGIRDHLSVLSKKTYKKRTKAVESLKETNPELYTSMKQELDEEIKESFQAEEKLKEIKPELANLRRLRTNIAGRVRAAEEDHEAFDSIQYEINRIAKEMIPEELLLDKTKEELEWFLSLFKDDFYIELQYHRLEAEQKIMPLLANLAKDYHVPVVAANDVHIKDQKQIEARQFMKALRFDRWEEASASDEELYIKTYDELSDILSEILDENTVKQAILNIQTICDQCRVIIPETSHYPKYRDENGNEVEDSIALLRTEVYHAIPDRYQDGLTEEQMKRLEYELETIIRLGYADYILIVADFINFAKQYSMNNNEMKIGFGVGPGRGSAVGSIVCYLLKITELDPLKYGLIFERFLNPERISMPDIDTDFSNEVRDVAIAYVRKKYGDESVACIRTEVTQGAKNSIKNSARIRGYEMVPGKKTDRTVITKRQPFQSLGIDIAKTIPEKPGIQLKECEDELNAFQEKDKEAKIIIRRARQVEGTITTLSIHAAGVIIGDGKPLKDYVPLHYNVKKRQWAVQCNMGEAERMKLLKMDFLGLNNFDIISDCVRRIKRIYGRSINIYHLPMEIDVFREIFSKGSTGSVFQFESGGMKQMLKEFKPECFEDIILLVAAYRPGPMEFIPEIIEVKFGRKKPHYLAPQLEPILSGTYGSIIYQEQVMQIVRDLAGFSMGRSDLVRRAMSKKKTNVMEEERQNFVYGNKKEGIPGCIANGISEEAAHKIYDSMIDFAKYAFNKSHAAVYALIAYITAWLKYHYPVEYMCSVLNHSPVSKLPALLNSCKEMNIKVLPPDINQSYSDFTIDVHNNIIYGLNAIKGVAKYADHIIKERKENGPFSSFLDFIMRAHEDKGVTETLIKAGVFDICDSYSRIQLSSITDEIILHFKDLKKCREQIEECEAALSEDTKNRKTERQLKSAIDKRERLLLKIEGIKPRNLEDSLPEILRDEFELLGAYISGHPLDAYNSLYQSGEVIHICDIENEQTGNFAGIIEHLKLIKRKSDGKEMAFFQLSDNSGNLKVCCFTSQFAKYKSLLIEGNVIKIYGNIKLESSLDNDQEFCLYLKTASRCKPEKQPILFAIRQKESLQECIEKIEDYLTENGHPLYIHDCSTGNLLKKNGDIITPNNLPTSDELLRVKKEILDTSFENIFMKLIDF